MSVKTGAGEVGDDWVAATAAAVGADGAALLERMRSVVPAGYDELNWPNSAALDLPVVDHLLRDGVDGQIDTAMMHFDEAGEHQWRFRVYHRGRALAISDLLPLLDQIEIGRAHV